MLCSLSVVLTGWASVSESGRSDGPFGTLRLAGRRVAAAGCPARVLGHEMSRTRAGLRVPRQKALPCAGTEVTPADQGGKQWARLALRGKRRQHGLVDGLG